MEPTSDKTDTWKSVLKKVVRYTVQIGIIGYLFYKLYDIGFSTVLESLPLDPLFYLIYITIYFSLPLSEILIYSIGWHFKPMRAFMVFVQKKVLNTDVLGYSGEVYLFYWAKNKLKIPVEDALHFIKDNNILSSISSTFVSVILLIFFFTQGYLNPLDYLPDAENSYIYILVAAGVLLAGFVIYKFRHYILSVSLVEGLKISSIYTVRLFITNALQILQYALVKPDIPWAVWFSLMAVQILSTRIPFLPSQDVLYVNLALEMSDLVRVPEQELVGILTANLILQKLIGGISFLLTSARQTTLETMPDDEDIQEYKTYS
ncbi:hypothetical protein NC796_08300 [Aliifodinibius sp. S!AR15-10]|uniref:hypothetical protein n=1 Tax=Aliifodinibius sp. S!AR15-10 TaxID=2950437 RepID=UPI00285E42DC|nr:hypothetical protein [Aliifodinibius sp. S!AR15-10]MDR8391134.1 hypothetical protein [Aliifodinibius sp. S!AR15-10]